MTPERIEELKGLCAKATPVASWECDSRNGEVYYYSIGPLVDAYIQAVWDANFMTEARSAVPELITEVEKLRRQLRVAVDFINQQRQDQLLFIEEQILDFFKGDQTKADLWWRTPNYMLGDVSPEDMILLNRFGKLVQFVLHSLEENEEPK